MWQPFGHLKKDVKGQSGLGMIELMIATALLGILGTAIAILSNNFEKNGKSVERRLFIEEVARVVAHNLDCDATFASKGITFPGGSACPATSDNQPPTSPWLTPWKKDKYGQKPIFDGAQQADGSFFFGQNRVRITCSSAEATLIVQAVPINSKDPSDWTLPENSVYGQVTTGPANRRRTYMVRKPLCFNDDKNRAPKYLTGGSCPADYAIVNCTGGGNLSQLNNGCTGNVKCVKIK